MEAWYPPGHGDFYQSFHNSGLLEEFIGQVRPISNQNLNSKGTGILHQVDEPLPGSYNKICLRKLLIESHCW
jgi:UTP--glucose-1-phosphate uridylyltransferase